jgi:hypothetical protein
LASQSVAVSNSLCGDSVDCGSCKEQIYNKIQVLQCGAVRLCRVPPFSVGVNLIQFCDDASIFKMAQVNAISIYRVSSAWFNLAIVPNIQSDFGQLDLNIELASGGFNLVIVTQYSDGSSKIRVGVT